MGTLFLNILLICPGLLARFEVRGLTGKCVLQVEKSLESMEEEAEKLYRDERPSLVEDEAAATRDMMYVSIMITFKTQRPT